MCFQKIILLLILLFTNQPPSIGAEVIDEKNADRGRVVKNLDANWKFHKGTDEYFSKIGFDDKSWQQINLPHTWNAKDGTDGGDNYYRGDGWYRKEILVPESFKGKLLYLQVAAANKEAEVFVNGSSVGTHKGGYTGFTFEITDKVHYGKKNLIAVKVNNEKKDAIPLSGDFTFYGGLYRGIKLIAADPTHISVQDEGSSGILLSIPNEKSIKKSASVSVKVPVKIAKADMGKVTVTAAIKNDRGKKQESVDLKVDRKESRLADGSIVFTGIMTLENPHLWNGVKDPYLYSVDVTVFRNGYIADRVTEKTGLRYFSIDPNKGFFLNGKSYPLHGVAMHQDRKFYGNAVPDTIKEEDFQFIKEIGANSIRTAHYPHSKFVYDQADKMGLVVWTEIPFVNEMKATKEFAINTEQQLTEMIKQNDNHPSIVTWGLQNELGAFGGYIPGSRIPNNVQYQKATDLLQRLTVRAKKINPERFVSQAIMGVPVTKGVPLTPKVEEQLDWGSKVGKTKKFIDLSSLNFYFGWYTPDINDLDRAITKLHKDYSDAPLGLSEYGAGANPEQHQMIQPGFKWDAGKNAMGQWHPEEYQSYWHECSYSIIKKHPELWSTYVWALFDFGSDWRNEGKQPGINDKGLITFDRKIKKDAFYFYKAQWNTETPFLYITSRRFVNRTERFTPIKVYSNLHEVSLKVNGRDYGQGKMQQSGVFVWNNVKLKNRNNVVEASAKKADGTEVKDSVINWTVNMADNHGAIPKR